MGQWNRLPDPFVTEKLHSFANLTRHWVLSINPRSTLTRTLLPVGRFDTIPPATRELGPFTHPLGSYGELSTQQLSTTLRWDAYNHHFNLPSY